MGRKSRVTGASRPSSPPRRSVSTQAAARPPSPAPQAARQPPAPVAQAKPPAPAPAANAPAPQSSGPSMLGNFASSMAGSVAGSVIGHSIANMIGGSGSSEAVNEQQAPVQQEYAEQPQVLCSREESGFKLCLEKNNGDISMCQWAYDIMRECKVRTQNSEYEAYTSPSSSSKSSAYDRF